LRTDSPRADILESQEFDWQDHALDRFTVGVIARAASQQFAPATRSFYPPAMSNAKLTPAVTSATAIPSNERKLRPSLLS
jgi:hypothetical protein